MRLGDGKGMRIKEVPHAGVAADEDELPKRIARPALFEEPEQPLDRDVHDAVGRLLAGRQVQDVRDIAQGIVNEGAVGNAAAHDFEAIAGRQQALMAQGADDRVLAARVREAAVDEMGTDFAGGARDENAIGHS